MTEEMNSAEITYHSIRELLSVTEGYKNHMSEDGRTTHIQTKFMSSNCWDAYINSYWITSYNLGRFLLGKLFGTITPKTHNTA
jgi:hypothetical protein